MKTICKEFEVNGAKVALYPMKGVQAVVIRAMIHAGSWYETGRKWGAHHLLDHIIFDGNEKLKDRYEIEEYKEKYGIQNNAWTGGGYMEFWFKFPSKNIKHGFDLFEQMFFYSKVYDSDIKREISVISQEFIDHWSKPENRYWRAVQQGFYGKYHTLAKDAIGDPEYLKTIKR